MSLKQAEGRLPGFEIFRQLALQQSGRLPVLFGVRDARGYAAKALEHAQTVGINCRRRHDTGEEQDLICPGFADARETLKQLAGPCGREGRQGRRQISTPLRFDEGGSVLHFTCAACRPHAPLGDRCGDASQRGGRKGCG